MDLKKLDLKYKKYKTKYLQNKNMKGGVGELIIRKHDEFEHYSQFIIDFINYPDKDYSQLVSTKFGIRADLKIITSAGDHRANDPDRILEAFDLFVCLPDADILVQQLLSNLSTVSNKVPLSSKIFCLMDITNMAHVIKFIDLFRNKAGVIESYEAHDVPFNIPTMSLLLNRNDHSNYAICSDNNACTLLLNNVINQYLDYYPLIYMNGKLFSILNVNQLQDLYIKTKRILNSDTNPIIADGNIQWEFELSTDEQTVLSNGKTHMYLLDCMPVFSVNTETGLRLMRKIMTRLLQILRYISSVTYIPRITYKIQEVEILHKQSKQYKLIIIKN
jgi:hypothetical protein